MSKGRKNKTWEERYEEVVEYFQKNNKLPAQISGSDDKHLLSLGAWIQVQRKRYQEGRLSEERVELLNSINVYWSKIDRENRIWESNFNRLVAFRRQNPDRWPTYYSDDENERSLASWCEYNRNRKMGKPRRLNKYPDERRKALDSIGFLWGRYQRWYQGYKELKNYRRENPRRWPPVKMKKLYNWVRAQRIAYRKSLLHPKRIALLNKLYFDWNPEKRKY